MSATSSLASKEGMRAVCMYSMAAGVLGGAALAALAAHVPALTPAWCRRPAPKKVYVLLVQLKLNPAMGGARAFKEAWAALAEDVRKHEPACLSYELAEDTEDPNSIIIYERYLSKRDLDETHNSGAVFKAFGKRVGEGELKGLVVSKTKNFFIESNVGFMSRA